MQIAAAKLAKFSKDAAIYSSTEQRALLLKRASELASSISDARGTIAERTGQKRSYTEQLLGLRPVTRSPVISSLVTNLGVKGRGKISLQAERERSDVKPFDSEPPLLLVRVYQDTLTSLLKVNAELSGVVDLNSQLTAELEKVNKELLAIPDKEAEYNRLSQTLRLAKDELEKYSRRAVEEEINAGLASSRISSLRIAQVAIPPEYPIFGLIFFIPLALILGIMAALCSAIILEFQKKQVEPRALREFTNGSTHPSLNEHSIRDA